MRRIFFALVGLLTCVNVLADDSSLEESAVKWYRDQYAPIWISADGIDSSVAAAFYHDIWFDYSLMGRFVVQRDSSWVSHMVAEWVASGWTGSTLTAIEAKEINDHLVVFKARYDDRYKGAATQQSCGWYTAIQINETWAFTNYAEIDCAAHGL